ncbi:MAG: aldo/keto reductase [Paenibacillaceae bacterium]|jgi:aryl-alcohol dehydrogenase-like predicted oxidoreductase|nr:aldo/keto reductase [Paenibacillaceae bacterium]
MKYRRLGKTEINVSVVGIGTWQFSGSWGHDFNAKEAADILDTAKDRGINLIDTAAGYGRDHLSERLIGEYMHTQKREDWVIATKFGNYNGQKQYAPDQVLSQLNGSLKALQTDYIDVYQFHSGTNEHFDNDELWTMLDKQVQAGKIRHLGNSIGSPDNMHQAEGSVRNGCGVFQIRYNRIDRQPEETLLPYAAEQDIGVLVRVPLCSGFLTGKYKPGATFGSDDVRNKQEQKRIDRILREVEVIQQNEVPERMNMATWALAWCLNQEAVTAVIPGCKNTQQVLSNAEAADYVNR